MKKNYTHISIIMDRSGSMTTIAKDMEGGLTSLIETQKLVEGDATISLARFDDVYEVVYNFAPLKNASGFKLEPRGWTALLDAMGKCFTETKEKIKSMAEEDKPEKVLFIIITDGAENASKEFDKTTVNGMIKELRNCNEKDENQPDEDGINWDFIFLGANQDAIQEGGKYGIRGDAAMTYNTTSAGSQATFASLSAHLTTYRSMDNASVSFTEDDRKKALK